MTVQHKKDLPTVLAAAPVWIFFFHSTVVYGVACNTIQRGMCRSPNHINQMILCIKKRCSTPFILDENQCESLNTHRHLAFVFNQKGNSWHSFPGQNTLQLYLSAPPPIGSDVNMTPGWTHKILQRWWRLVASVGDSCDSTCAVLDSVCISLTLQSSHLLEGVYLTNDRSPFALLFFFI